MSDPLVTVVTASFDQAAFVGETIESVLGQEGVAVEYIVVDDGSTDGSVEVIERYRGRLAALLQGEDRGQAHSLNRGLAQATGRYVTWLNSDDTLLPGALARMVEALEADPQLVLVYGDSLFIDEASKPGPLLPARPWEPATMVRNCENHVPQPSSLFRRDAFERVGPLNERGYYFFDMELFLALGSIGKVRRLEGPPLSGYRLHSASKSYGAPLRKAEDYVRIAEEFLPSARLPEEAKPFVREGRARAWLGAAEYFYSGRDARGARRALRKGVALAPRVLTRRDIAIAARILTPSIVREWLRPRREARY
jgi:glycosyltransferase involved in cell wall biosynthesis